MKDSVRNMMKMNVYEFAKEILDIDISPVHQDFISRIERLNAKYGAGNWKLCFGRRGNAVIVSVPLNLTDSLASNAVGNGGGTPHGAIELERPGDHPITEKGYVENIKNKKRRR